MILDKKKSKKDRETARIREIQDEMNGLRVAIQESDRWKAYRGGTIGGMVSTLMEQIDREAYGQAKMTDDNDVRMRALGRSCFKDIFDKKIDDLINKGNEALLKYDLLEKQLTGRV